MKRLGFLLASVLSFSATSFAANPFQQLERLYSEAKTVDIGSFTSNSTKTFRGKCHELQSPEDAPNPKPVVFVLKVIDYPNDGPVLGKRVAYGYVTDGAKSESEAVNELEQGIEKADYFGFLQIDSNTYRNPGGHGMAANFDGCMGRLTKVPCNSGYVKKDDKYFYFSVGFRGDFEYPRGGYAYDYSNRLYCFADASGI